MNVRSVCSTPTRLVYFSPFLTNGFISPVTEKSFTTAQVALICTGAVIATLLLIGGITAGTVIHWRKKQNQPPPLQSGRGTSDQEAQLDSLSECVSEYLIPNAGQVRLPQAEAGHSAHEVDKNSPNRNQLEIDADGYAIILDEESVEYCRSDGFIDCKFEEEEGIDL